MWINQQKHVLSIDLQLKLKMLLFFAFEHICILHLNVPDCAFRDSQHIGWPNDNINKNFVILYFWLCWSDVLRKMKMVVKSFLDGAKSSWLVSHWQECQFAVWCRRGKEGWCLCISCDAWVGVDEVEHPSLCLCHSLSPCQFPLVFPPCFVLFGLSCCMSWSDECTTAVSTWKTRCLLIFGMC